MNTKMKHAPAAVYSEEQGLTGQQHDHPECLVVQHGQKPFPESMAPINVERSLRQSISPQNDDTGTQRPVSVPNEVDGQTSGPGSVAADRQTYTGCVQYSQQEVQQLHFMKELRVLGTQFSRELGPGS